jgi:ATP-dependent Clp protease adaptor protein ClpS
MSGDETTMGKLQTDTETLTRLRAGLLPPYKVILHNDDYNEMDYVVSALLQAINRLTPTEAEYIMLTAHLLGRAIAAICPKEIAEFYQERLLSFGLTATIEPDA